MKKIKQNKFNMKLNKKLFPILLAGFLLVGPAIALTVSAVCNPTCADECAYIGQRQESGDSYRICGNYDSDCCYEWSQWYTNTPTCNPTCADECSYIGQKKCSDSTYTQTCGNYDSDCCFEWSSPQSCGSGQVCQSGTCVTQEVNDPVTGSLTVSSYSVCRGQNISVTLTGQDDNGMVQLKLMVNDGADTYTFDCSGAQDCSHTWSITKSIAGTYKLTAKFFGEKPDGTSEVYSIDNIYIEFRECLPTVDIKANNSDGPITISYNSAAALTWTSNNANSCTASNAWSGTKATSGSESTGNLTSSKTYTITCTGSGGSASDSVTVNVSQNHPPTANAGPDKEVYETESVILEGSGSDPDGDLINYRWTCNGGTLFEKNVAQPIFYTPIVSGNTTFICTLTVTDSYGASASDSMNVSVKEHHCLTLSVSLSANPNSGCSPLNDVDLTAEVSGTASGEITYFFDCTNDGSWDKTITSGNIIYTASDLCDYSSAGNYTAKTRVQREGLSAENTTQIAVRSCCTAATVDIKANNSDGPITISYNSAAALTWTSTNADSCTASGAWSGTKSTSGSESSGNLTSAKSYTITCSNSCGQAADTVTVYIESQPTLSVSLSANPNSGCSPLNDVDLTTEVSGTASGEITYFFDCRNDGSWDKTITSGNTIYTASDLCDYSSAGNYTAKTRVQREGLSVENTTQIAVQSCYNAPIVDIKANGSNGPITIPYNDSANLTWTSENADSCYASNAWSGTKSISGSQSTGNLTSSKTYTITCTGSGGSASDSVTVNVDSYSTLSVSLSANPNSGCSPLNDVDLTAEVSGTASGEITYFFDCRNDGSWDKIYTTYTNWNDSYTAYNLCSYSSIRTYTAKVRVETGGLAAEDTISINSYSCDTYSPTVNIKANGSNGPITIPYNDSANLTWTSENADSCYASNAWSGTKSISGSQSTGNLTSSKTYTITCTGSGGSASDSVTVNIDSQVSTDFSIYKTVRNLSRGTTFSDLTYANPKEILTFGIGIKAGNDPLYNLVVKDFLPSGIIYQGDLRVDDILTTGDIFAGLNIGNLAAGQERRITFRGDVAGAESFSFGQTELTNTASVSSGSDSRSDSAKVVVTRAAVAGAATDVSTGLTNNILLDSFLLPLMITLLIIWLFKSRIIKFEEWLDLRKKEYQIYKSKKILQIKIAKIKVQELFQKII